MDPDQTPHSAPSDLGLLCLLWYLFRPILLSQVRVKCACYKEFIFYVYGNIIL